MQNIKNYVKGTALSVAEILSKVSNVSENIFKNKKTKT